MALSAEFQRHIEAAMAAQDDAAKEILRKYQKQLEADEQAGKIHQLPVEDRAQTPVTARITVVETTVPPTSQTELEHALAVPDLRKRALELLRFVQEPTDEEKKALQESRGLVFLPMTAQSYAEVVAEHEDHYWSGELDYAKSRKSLREYRPPVPVEVGLNSDPQKLALPASFDRPRADVFKMIEEYSQGLATEFPGFMAIPLPATGYARADRAYAERNPGRVLFPNYFVWCLDNLSGVDAADAGRDAPTLRFGVYEWPARRGRGTLGGVPAVVKIGN